MDNISDIRPLNLPSDLGRLRYMAQVENMSTIIVKAFAQTTNGVLRASKDYGIPYIQYTQDVRGPLFLWVLPPASSMFDSVAVRGRIERQRRSIIARADNGGKIGYHGLIRIDIGIECFFEPQSLQTLHLSLQSDNTALINGAAGRDGLRLFRNFVDCVFAKTENEMFADLESGPLVL